MFHVVKEIGSYFLLMRRVFSKPERQAIYFRQIIVEMDYLGLQSIGIVLFISLFMGAVVTIQTVFNIDSPLIPLYTVGFATRQSMILEFAPTIISLILAGKVGSRIASEIGTMKVTEQIDALEIMGINSASYLIMPKIIGAILINPILIILSMFVSIAGGYLAGTITNLISSTDFIIGLQYQFRGYDIFYALVKTVVFAFLITSISGYHGYKTQGGALEVGQASTTAVVQSSIFIILFNLILTQILLA